jgi:AcrR family transcriptional regulator
MAEQLETAAPARRRRSDARRSIDAILAAAGTVLAERPDASIEDIAGAAGVARQTVYAHFASRDTLIAALVESARTQGLAELAAARLDLATPTEALARILDAGWELLRRYPLLLEPAFNRVPRLDGSDPHRTVAEQLEEVIVRGQQDGDFDGALPAGWLAAAVIDLGHTAAEQVTAGKLMFDAARAVLLESALRLCRARP